MAYTIEILKKQYLAESGILRLKIHLESGCALSATYDAQSENLILHDWYRLNRVDADRIYEEVLAYMVAKERSK